jgi:nitrate/nitrite transporter NarK
MAMGGIIIATAGGFLLHILPGTVLVIMAGVAWIIAPLLFAIAPEGANYWAYTFPSMICATIAIDVTFSVSNVFISTSFPLKRQGLAGALSISVLMLGVALFLGLGDLVANGTAHQGLKKSYKNAFWFEVAAAAVALVLLVGFVKIDKAKSDMTADERAAQEAELQEGN